MIEFSLGMGPRLFSFEKGGTRYSLKLLPFGGSCMMLGEFDDLSDEEKKENEANGEPEVRTYAGVKLAPGASGVSFNETSVWTRFKVIAAGPIFNFILAFVCAFFIISTVGYESPQIGGVMEGYPAEAAGLQAGDVLTKVNGKSVKIFRDLSIYTSFHPGETLEIEYRRGTERLSAVVEPQLSEESGGYLIGVSASPNRTPESIFVTAKYSFYELRYWINLTFKSLGMIVRRQVTANDIAGPARIISMIDSSVRENSEYGMLVVMLGLANMCILLSANLGVMNLLPIPALDGGRLIFIILEGLRGRPIDQEKEGMIHMAGMALLMLLMVFVLFNDIRNML